MNLVATRSMRYATRALAAGDEFSANRRDARVLCAIGKARHAEDAPVDPMDALRAVAAAVGVEVDRRWGETRLRAEIEAANAK